MSAVLVNPFAPPAYNGLNDASPERFVDVDFEYIYDVVLTASQILRDQTVSIVNDADFAWRAVNVNFHTGAFSVRFADSQGYYLSSGMILDANLQGDPSSPYPIFPEIVIPAGGRIGIDIADLSAAPNTIQIGFRGVKRFRIAQPA